MGLKKIIEERYEASDKTLREINKKGSDISKKIINELKPYSKVRPTNEPNQLSLRIGATSFSSGYELEINGSNRLGLSLKEYYCRVISKIEIKGSEAIFEYSEDCNKEELDQVRNILIGVGLEKITE